MMDIKYKSKNIDATCIQFVKILDEIFVNKNKPIQLHEPQFQELEKQYLQDCLKSTFVSNIGEYVNNFEKLISEYTGSRYVTAVVNGTVALQVSLHLLGVQPNDEVLIPSLSFVATANAVVHSGAIPHFLDIDRRTLGINTEKLEEYLNDIAIFKNGNLFNKITGRRISVILPMHTFGHAVKIEEILEISKKFKLKVLEDAAEALGSRYKKKHLGTFGEVGILSFNGNKIITTGGGGAILTDNLKLSKLAKHLTTTAKKKHPWEFYHDQVAWNFRMPNLNAALGCAQMKNLDNILKKKRKLAKKYQKYFENQSEFKFFIEPELCRSNYWLNLILLEKSEFKIRNAILFYAIKNGYNCRPAWKLLNKLPMYKNNPSMDLKIANQVEKKIICIPSSPKLYNE